ncbi:MAG: pyruvate synthase subunit PorB [Candidatus Thermoplasmatota archaeon]
MSIKVKDLPKEELFTSGHTACGGCGCPIMVRAVMKVLGPKTVTYFPANCLLVFGGTYPLNAFNVPYLHVLFENSAVCAAGIKRALKRLGREDVNVVAFAGDGGTADIGIQALSGAAERNEDILYICYDNEAYMNTGIQRSSATPYHTWTTTTPSGRVVKGKEEHKKDVPRIVIAHDVPYVATASIGFPNDMLAKIEKARDIHGFRYIQIFAPCPTGWRLDPAKTVEIAKMAVECGMWTLYEFENGRMRITKMPKMSPVRDYLMLQGRFRHLTEEQIAQIQQWANEKWARDQRMAEVYK